MLYSWSNRLDVSSEERGGRRPDVLCPKPTVSANYRVDRFGIRGATTDARGRDASGFRISLAKVSISNTEPYSETLGVTRSRTASHDRVRKAGLQPDSDVEPNRIAVDLTAMRVDGQRRLLYAVVDSDTDQSPPSGSFRRVRRSRFRRFFAPRVRNNRSLLLRFSLNARHLGNHSTDFASDFACAAMRLGTPSNVSLVR